MRRTVSFRLSIAVVVPVLVGLVGVLIAGQALWTTKRLIDELTTHLFTQVGSEAAEETGAHVSQAIPAADLVVALLRDANLPADITQDDALVLELADVLRANPGFAWVSFSDVTGSFVGVQRRSDGVRTNRSHIVAGKTDLVEHTFDKDGTLRLANHNVDTQYDPRTRPFFELATKAHHRIWTPPYIFFGEGIAGAPQNAGARQGITCAAPVYARDGTLRGVVTVDFDLGALSRFVAELHLSPHAVVFLYSDDGTILAHPSLHLASHGKGGELVTKSNIDDPLVRTFFDKEPSARFDFEHDGQLYLATSRAFTIDEGALAWHVGAIAPERDFNGPLEGYKRFAIAVSAIAIVIGAALGIAFSRALAKPLAGIATEMERAGRFEITDHVPSHTRFTEINAMDRALGAMKGGLHSFGAYVPRDLVRAVLATGVRAELGGKTKRLTIFFSDLAGFTTISETLAPEALVELLGGYFDEMTKVIQSRGGTIDKFIGDAIMAFWNAPKDEPRHAALACEAAIACQKKLDAMRQSDPKLAGLRARIGIATGDVLVGNIGSSDRMNYTVMGDTVNLASRLEGLNKAYGTPVMISAATYEACHDEVLARPIDVVAVKGKATGVRVLEPIGARAGASKADERLCDASTRALDAYLARDFANAIKAWDEALAIRPGDGPSTLMKARAMEYAASPPPADWNGVAVMHEK
jgi:adenylate cyclase